MRRRGRSTLAAVLTGLAALGSGSAAHGAEPAPARQFVAPPPGFSEACQRYRWLCESGRNGRTSNAEAPARPDPPDLMRLADRVNRRVNGSVRELTDAENYGVAEHWTLPTNGSGDCEDFVLQKYRLLLDAGVGHRDLSVAVALNSMGENHAVLVLHMRDGDFVLDSLTSRILPWNRTGYRFLAMQVSGSPGKWQVVTGQPRHSQILAQR